MQREHSTKVAQHPERRAEELFAQIEDLGDGSMLDGQIGTLVAAMATFQANNPSFDPTAGANTQAPADAALQAAIAAAWHH